MRVLLTGGTGFIGGALTLALVDARFNITAVEVTTGGPGVLVLNPLQSDALVKEPPFRRPLTVAVEVLSPSKNAFGPVMVTVLKDGKVMLD